MPQYKITLPDGTAYRVTAPSESAAYSALQQSLAPSAEPVDAGPKQGRGGVLPSFAEGFVTSFTDIPLGIAGLYSAKPEETALGKFSTGAEKVVQDILGIDPTKEATTAESVAGGLGSLASFLVPGTLAAKGARALGAGAQAARAASYVAAGAQAAPLGAAEQVQRRMAEEASTGVLVPEQDRIGSQLLGGAIGLSELATLGRFFGPLEKILAKVPLSKAGGAGKVVEGAVKRALVSATEEGAQEALAQGAQNLVEQGYYNPDLDITEGLLSSAGVGGAAGGTLDVVLQLMAGRKAGKMRTAFTQLERENARQAAEKTPERIRADAIAGRDELLRNAPSGEIKITSADNTETGFKFKVVDASGKAAATFDTKDAAVLAAEQYERDNPGAVTFIRPTIAEVARTTKGKPTKQEKKQGKKIAQQLEAEGSLQPAPAQLPTTPAGQATTGAAIAETVQQVGATPTQAAEIVNPAAPKKGRKKRIAPVEAPVEAPAGAVIPEGIAAPPPVSTTAAEIPAPPTAAPAVMEFGTADERAAIRREIAPQAETFRDMTPEQQAAYNAELDRRYPGRSYSVFPTPTAPQATPTAAPVSPSEAPPAAVQPAPAAKPPKEFKPSVQALFKPVVTSPDGVRKLQEFEAKRDEVAKALNNRLAPIVGSQARVQLVDVVRQGKGIAEGEVLPAGDVIYLSYNLYDPNLTVDQMVDKLFDVMNHEVIHSLSNLGLFRGGELPTLFKAAERIKYRGNQFTYYDRAVRMYATVEGYKNPDGSLNEEMIHEEAVAEMFRDARAGKLKLEGTPKGVFGRIVEFFKRLFNGYRDAKVGQIFKDIEAGKMGAREARAVEGGVRKFSIIPTKNIVVKPGGTIPPSTPAPSPQEVAAARADTVMGAEAVRNRLPIVVPEQERVINGVYVVGTPDGRRWVALSPQELAVRGPGFAGSDADLQKMWEDTLKEVSEAARIAVERTGASWKAFPAAQWDKALRLPLRSQLWYELSGESFIDGLPDLAYNEHMMFLDLVGATSARAEPKDNLERALAVLSQRLRGVPIDVDITIASTVSDALRRNGTDISSALANKTGMFSDTLALAGGLPVRYPISVNDVWVGKAFGISDDLMSANQALHEAFAKYANKLRDFVNASGGHQFPHQSWHLQARQWVELRAADEGVDTSVGSTVEGSDYAGEWAGIVKKLKAAGLPVKNNKITRDILLDPRFADALRPTTPAFRDAPKATVEFGTLLTPNGRNAAKIVDVAKRIGDDKTPKEYLRILSTAMYRSGRGKPTLWQDTVRLATGESASVTRIYSPTSEDPFAVSGTFEGSAGPNIRVPLKNMTADQIAYFNAMVGLGLKQKAMAAAEIRVFPTQIPSDYISTKRIRFDFDGAVPEKMLTDFTSALGPGFEISVMRYPDGITMDINPKFGENGIETVDGAAVDRAFDVIKTRYGASNPEVFDVGFKSEYGKNYVEDDGTGAEYRKIINKNLRDWKNDAKQKLGELGLNSGQAELFLKGADLKEAAPAIKVSGISGKAETVRKQYAARIDYHNSTARAWREIGKDVDREMGEALSRWMKRIEKTDPASAEQLRNELESKSVKKELDTANGIAEAASRTGEASQAEVDVANQAVRDAVRKLSTIPQPVPMPPEMEDANRRIFAATHVPSTPGEKLMGVLGGLSSREGIGRLADMFRVYYVQKTGQITKMERQAYLTGALNPDEAEFAEYSATGAADMMQRASHYTVEAAYHGAPVIRSLNAKREAVSIGEGGDPNSAYMYIEKDQADSPLKVLEKIITGGPNGGDLTEQFRSYAIAQVSKRRLEEGKDIPEDITPEYIEAADALAEQYPIIKEAFESYQRFNTKLLEAVRDSGYLSQELFEEFTDQQNYYSMYRQLEEGDVVQELSGGLASRIRFKAYEGSTTGNLMADPIVAMMHNVAFWNNVILRTLATQKAFRVGEATGVVKRLRAFEDEEGNVTIETPSRADGFDDKTFYTYINGVEVPFASRDPLFTIGLSGNDFASPSLFLELAGMPADFLREMVTRDPGFMVANLMRDSVSTWVLAGSGANPFQTFKGFISALNSSASFEALRSYGVVGSFDEAQKPMAKIVAGMRQKLTKVQGLPTMTSALSGAWNKLGSWSEASDAATRIAVYEAAKRSGASDFTAAYRALSIMNFSRSGHSAGLRMWTRMVPFLNARIQGFDVLYTGLKSATGVLTGREQLAFERQRGTHVLVRGMALTAAAMALSLLLEDDEEYQQLPQYIKDANILIPIPGEKGKYFQIPKPFEAGFLFMTVPQTFYDVAMGNRSMRSATKLMFNQFSSTFGFNPIPQAALPIVENMINRDFYTGQPLISPGMEQLETSLQYNASTSYVARGLSQLSGFLPINYDFEEGRFVPISPIKLDNLISGYGGPIMSYIGMGIGGAAYMFGADNQGLPVAGSQLPVIRRFFVDARDKQPQAATEAYELYQLVDKVTRTVSRLKKMGDTEALKEYREENINILRVGKQVRKMADNLNNIRAQIRRLEADKVTPMSEKLERLRELRSREIRVTRRIDEINQQLGR